MLERQRVEVLEGTRPLLDRSRLGVIALGLIALAMAGLIARDVFFPPAPAAASVRLATVQTGNVSSTVSATGSVVPQAQQNVNFRQAGVLSEVDVKVSDRVKSGQVLAKQDPRAQQSTLATAEANLASSQANLQAALTPVTPEQLSQLQHSLANAQQSYNDTVAQVNLTASQDGTAVLADQQNVITAQNQLNTDTTTLNNSVQYQYDKAKLQQDQAALTAAQNKWFADGCNTSGPPPICTTDQAQINTLQQEVNADQQRVNQDEAQIHSDQASVTSAQNRLYADQQKQTSDTQANQSKLNSAANAITSAQDSLAVQTTLKPNTIAAAQASVQSSQAAVDTAKLNLDLTTLAAPMDGVILSVNGAPGESVGAGSGTTPQSPGSSAPQPSSSSSSGTGSSSSSSFMVIANDTGLQAVAAFAESDAARLQPGQTASLTFDAVPGLTMSGKVLAVNSGATVVSSVVNYVATIVLDRTDPKLKQGMTANTSVSVATATNVALVQNSAITHRGSLAFVNLYKDGKQVQTPVQLGVVGDSTTQIVAGVQPGDKVVLPQLRAPTSSTQGRGTGGISIGGGSGGR